MIKKINSTIIRGIMDLTYTMWKKGWDESNGGNISCILSEFEISEVSNELYDGEEVLMTSVPEEMIGKYIAITATRSQFRTVKDNPTSDIGIITIVKSGYQIAWGFEGGKRATSEFYMHLLSHNARLKVDANHKVVVHNHANNATAYSLVVNPNDSDYTLPLWQVLTESIVVFPDGVGVLPWQLPGTEEIGLATAEKLKESRIVVWTFHGILATGTDFQDCFGLIETVDKAAEIYMDTLKIKKFDGLSKEDLIAMCKHLGVTPKSGILN